MNERTHFFIKIYLSHFILERGCFLCVRGELGTGTDCYILTPSSYDHSSTSFAFLLGCSTVSHWGPNPSVWSWFSLRWHLISNWLQLQLELELTQAVCGTWLYNRLGFWYTNRSPNLGQKTRSYSNKQQKKKKKKIWKTVDFAVPADYRIKLKEREKRDKYLDLARELKKITMEYEGDNYTNCDWCFWYGN